jgi:hypothetical protein
MDHPKYPKSYIEMAKQFSVDEKYHEMHHQKKQGRQYEMSKGAKAWKEAPLDREQVDELFWNTLVKYGWKQRIDKNRIDLVLPCPRCEEPIVIFTYITGSEVSQISQPNYADTQIFKHRCQDPEA